MGGADFGGGMTEWQTLQFLSKISLPSGAAVAGVAESAAMHPVTARANPVVVIFRRQFMVVCVFGSSNPGLISRIPFLGNV